MKNWRRHHRIALWTLWEYSGFQDRFIVTFGRAPSLKSYPHQVEPGTSAVRSSACELSVTPCGLLKLLKLPSVDFPSHANRLRLMSCAIAHGIRTTTSAA